MALQLAHITDKGAVRLSNQDSFCARISNFGQETIALLTVCDGMGGLQSGELASTGAVRGFENWFEQQLPSLVREGLTEEAVFLSWHRMLETLHETLCGYSEKEGIRLGTTVSALLLTRERFYQAQIGDSRIYLDDGITLEQMTKDQTLAMREKTFTGSDADRPAKQCFTAMSRIRKNGTGVQKWTAPAAGRCAIVQ